MTKTGIGTEIESSKQLARLKYFLDKLARNIISMYGNEQVMAAMQELFTSGKINGFPRELRENKKLQELQQKEHRVELMQVLLDFAISDNKLKSKEWESIKNGKPDSTTNILGMIPYYSIEEILKSLAEATKETDDGKVITENIDKIAMSFVRERYYNEKAQELDKVASTEVTNGEGIVAKISKDDLNAAVARIKESTNTQFLQLSKTPEELKSILNEIKKFLDEQFYNTALNISFNAARAAMKELFYNGNADGFYDEYGKEKLQELAANHSDELAWVLIDFAVSSTIIKAQAGEVQELPSPDQIQEIIVKDTLSSEEGIEFPYNTNAIKKAIVSGISNSKGAQERIARIIVLLMSRTNRIYTAIAADFIEERYGAASKRKALDSTPDILRVANISVNKKAVHSYMEIEKEKDGTQFFSQSQTPPPSSFAR